MKEAPKATPARANWPLRIGGLLLVLACLAYTPWVWKHTKVVLPKFKETKGSALKVRVQTLKPLALQYTGVLAGLIIGTLLLRRSWTSAGRKDSLLTPARPV